MIPCDGVTHILDVFERMQLRAETAMYTKELSVHHRCKRQRAERLNAGFVDSIRILMLTL